jgi:hypothetical protein
MEGLGEALSPRADQLFMHALSLKAGADSCENLR